MSVDLRARARVGLAAAAALAALLTAGCGEDTPERELDLPRASASGSAGAEESPVAGLPAGVPTPTTPPRAGTRVDSLEAGAFAIRLPEGQPARAVGQVLVDYLDARLRAYNTGVFDLASMSAVAVEGPLVEVQSRVVELENEGLRTVGNLWVELDQQDVRVRGKQAKVGPFCLRNSTVNVNTKGVAVESPAPAYTLTATLRRFGEVWVVRDIEFDALPSPC